MYQSGIALSSGHNMQDPSVLFATGHHNVTALPFKNVLSNYDPLAAMRGTDWYDLYIENCDLRLCSLDYLNMAFASAPSVESQVYVSVVYEMRKYQTAMSGAKF